MVATYLKSQSFIKVDPVARNTDPFSRHWRVTPGGGMGKLEKIENGKSGKLEKIWVRIKRTPGGPPPPSRRMREGGPRAFSLFEPDFVLDRNVTDPL